MIVSPLSVSSALALLSQGAGGKTYEQLKQTLHLGNDKSAVANQYCEHCKALEKNAGEATLSIANRVYVQQRNQLSETFQELATSKFKSGVESLNFAESKKSASTINRFVEENTNGKIKELFKPDQFDADTQSVLVNAIYFNGKWETPFDKSKTKEGYFHISETETEKVDFMSQTSVCKMGYIQDLSAIVLELKYANSTMAFVIVS